MVTLATDYFPTPAQINAADIANARARLATYLASWWPELDTRPGSVFGDLDLTPRGVMTAAGEIAWSRFKSDLQLANVAQGIIYDEAFVAAFLKNFGVSAQAAIAATGTVQIVFSANKSYVLDPGSSFTFGASVFQISPNAGDPVIVYPAGSSQGSWVLTQIAPGQFAVYLPVTGPAGSAVQDGDTPQVSLTQQEIISVSAAGHFDSGSPPETLPQLAVRAQRTFASASLTSRSGAISFISQLWPNLVGVSVVVTGDREMIRASRNPLGIAEGALDVCLKSRATFSSGQVVLPLAYDGNLGGWVGRIALPGVPAFFDTSRGIFQVTNFQGAGVNTLYSRSVHPRIDNLGVAYSKYEQLGILVADTNPADFQAASNGGVTETTGAAVTLEVSGAYTSYFFNAGTSRSVNLRLGALTTVAGQAALLGTVTDQQNGDTAVVYFLPNSLQQPAAGIIYTDDPGYRQMFNGLSLVLTIPGGVFRPASCLGANFQFAFNAKSASFNVNYLFDAALVPTDSTLQASDNKPVQTSVLTKSFVPCYIDQFVVNYRTRPGTVFDAATARQQIFDYLSTLVYPEVYEESSIGAIVMQNGAASLRSVTKHGRFYPSLAGQYINKAGQVSAIRPVDTATLLPPANDQGFGPRNMAYLVDQKTIAFNAFVN